MLKKTREEADGKPMQQAKELSQAVLDSSHQIWLAGLGAFSRAQAEGMKMFETLVRQGARLETRTRQAAADTAVAARGAASAKAKEVQKMAGGTWDKLEQVFEDRVARALSKLGVYTQNDVERLAERVDALSTAVNRLIKESGDGGATHPRPRRSGAPAKKSRAASGGGSETAKVASTAKSSRKGPAKKRARKAAKSAA